MPKVGARKTVPEVDYYPERTDVSSVIFGLVMVVALIVAGAAMLGGSLSKAGERWANAMDGVSRSVGLSVGTVEVIGLEHVPGIARKVQEAAMIAPGENMFRADPHLIRKRVEETRLVSNVRVYRLWPDTLMIRADAVQPRALWENGGEAILVDRFGKAIGAAPANMFTDLPRFSGEGAPKAASTLLSLMRAHTKTLEADLKLARRISDQRWDIELKSGATLRLPGDADLKAGLQSYARFEAEGQLSSLSLSAIDLRVPGRIFLTPQKKQQEGAA